MNGFFKKTISLILVMIISVGIITPASVASVKGASPVEIGYTVSADSLYKGDKATVKFFFKNFADANIDCSAFQLNVYVDPAIFTASDTKCNLDGTGAMMYTTRFRSDTNEIKTIYFNTAGTLPKDSKDICSFVVELNRDFEKATDVQINVTLAMALDVENNRYDVTYSSPVIKCLPLSEKPQSSAPVPPASDAPVETIVPENSVPETSSPTSNPQQNQTSDKEYTVTYLDSNGRLITTEKVKEGKPAANSMIPYRPGYDFKGWHVGSGTLKNVTSDMSVTAVYELNETLYTIEVAGGTVNGSYKPVKAKYDDCVVVKLDDVSVPEGSYFLGWKKSGCDKIISYNKTYSFLVTSSVQITPVFSKTQEKTLPQTVLYAPAVNSEGVVFLSENYIPEGYSYSGAGIIVTKTKGVGTSEEMFVLNAASVTAYRADKNSINSQFCLVSNNLAVEFYARSYMIYKNSTGEKITVYSDIGYYTPNLA